MKAAEGKTIELYGVRITIFKNGDAYISTEGDVHILKARAIITDKIMSLE